MPSPIALRHNARKITAFGRTWHTLTAFAQDMGRDKKAIQRRLAQGRSAADIVKELRPDLAFHRDKTKHMGAWGFA